jgi:hypothetical protein
MKATLGILLAGLFAIMMSGPALAHDTAYQASIGVSSYANTGIAGTVTVYGGSYRPAAWSGSVTVASGPVYVPVAAPVAVPVYVPRYHGPRGHGYAKAYQKGYKKGYRKGRRHPHGYRH